MIDFLTFFQDIFEKIQPVAPHALIVDSIQTVYLKGVVGSAGGIVQVVISTPYPAYDETSRCLTFIGCFGPFGMIEGRHSLNQIMYLKTCFFLTMFVNVCIEPEHPHF
jgi:hypothetical protein